jgi:site-specific DNA-methyltransferase (adenine-specific)
MAGKTLSLDGGSGNRPETPETVQGRLLESAHITGYTLERAVSELKWLIADDRWKHLGYEDGTEFVETMQNLFGSAKIPVAERKDLAKQLTAIANQRATAKLLGVDEGTVRLDLGTKVQAADKSAREQTEATENQAENGAYADKSAPAVFQSSGAAVAAAAEQKLKADAKRAEKEDKREAKKAAEAKAVETADRSAYDIRQSSVAELSWIADASVDVIITDPPYPQEFLPSYSELAVTAARILKPDGSCFVMVGQSYLPEIMDRLCEHLIYNWCLTYLTPGGQAVQLWDRKVNTFWKPILWFINGEYDGQWIGDVRKSNPNDNDKRFHHWGQSESGMADLIRAVTQPGDLICDPFLGGGTTAVVALDLGRRFVGSDIEQDCVDRTIARLGGVVAD